MSIALIYIIQLTVIDEFNQSKYEDIYGICLQTFSNCILNPVKKYICGITVNHSSQQAPFLICLGGLQSRAFLKFAPTYVWVNLFSSLIGLVFVGFDESLLFLAFDAR